MGAAGLTPATGKGRTKPFAARASCLGSFYAWKGRQSRSSPRPDTDQIPPERRRCGWLARCFDRTGTEHPEHCLLHHPARSAPDQMPRVTGAQRCTWERHLDLECRARSRLTAPWPGRAQRPLLGRTFCALSLVCVETLHMCVVADARSQKAKPVAPHTTRIHAPACAPACMCSPCRSDPCSQSWQGKFCRCPASSIILIQPLLNVTQWWLVAMPKHLAISSLKASEETDGRAKGKHPSPRPVAIHVTAA